MTNPEKKKQIDRYFDDALKAAREHRMEAFFMYCGVILGMLETIDSCGKDTKAFRTKTTERLNDIITYYKRRPL